MYPVSRKVAVQVQSLDFGLLQSPLPRWPAAEPSLYETATTEYADVLIYQSIPSFSAFPTLFAPVCTLQFIINGFRQT